MSAMSRFGPVLVRSVLIQQQRHMASAGAASEPIQKLFVDKIREFKANNKGLDESHQKMLQDEMLRLSRVYQVEDENKLTRLEYKHSKECDVALYDIDQSKELRDAIHSGEYQKQLTSQPAPKSELLSSIADPTPKEFALPRANKPNFNTLMDNMGTPEPHQLGEPLPDYMFVGNPKITPDDIMRDMRIKFADNMPTINDDKAPGRNAVDFPRLNLKETSPPTRYHIIPESWFQFFYPKTGLTGPYIFSGAFFTFLMSKEWLVMEHELLTAFSSIVIFGTLIPIYGPRLKKPFVEMAKDLENGWRNWQEGNAKTLGAVIANYKKDLNFGEMIDELYQARRQEVELQVEKEYRSRLQRVHDDTKRRLNYLVSVADSQRQIHLANMVNWVISNVHSSFGAKQESEVLDNCIVNLKQLAVKHANSI